MAKKSKGKGINLKIWIPIGVVALIIIISLSLLMNSKTRVAFLNIEEGSVEVDEGGGWEPAEDGMKLSLHDKVRTLNGKAILILYESIIVQLDPNTEVEIEQLSREKTKLNQDSGTTWNKFAAIAGIKNFEIETPTTVATVRGTSFWVDMKSVGVTEGQVDVQMQDKKMTVKAGNKAVLRDTVAKLEKIGPEEIRRAIAHKKVVVEQLKNLRQEEIEKHQTTYNFVKKLKGWDDAEVTRKMDKLDKGEYNEDELKEQAIIPSETVDKFVALSKEIRKQKEDIRKLQENSQQLSNTNDLERPDDEITLEPTEREIREKDSRQIQQNNDEALMDE